MAVEASRRWYDDVCALHGIPVRLERGLWSALGPPPPWHSAAKTLEPGVDEARVVRAVEALPHCAVADSFGDLDLGAHGFRVLFEATWVHRGVTDPLGRTPPAGWSVVDSSVGLAAWSTAHHYDGVLTAAVLEHPRFHVLALHGDGHLVGGGVTHDAGDVVGLSNAWGAGAIARSDGLVAAAEAVHPGRPFTDYATGAELEAMLSVGFIALGPQRVWAR